VSPSPMISGYVLPFLGIGIVLFCILSFVFPYGEKFKDKTQKIKGFGVDLEVSVLTLFVIIGVVLSLTGLYLQIEGYDNQLKDYERQVAAAKAEAVAAQQALERGRRMQMSALITLEGVNAAEMPKLEEMRCEYFLYGSEKPVEVQVGRGLAGNQLRVAFKDITADTVIRSLVLQDRSSQRKWAYENFAPFEPFYVLKRQE